MSVKKDDVVLVTGAAGGLGLAIAERFGEKEANVIITDVDESRLREAEQYLRGKGYAARKIVCNLSDKAQVAHMFSQVEIAYKQLDVLINNAGGGFYTPTALEDIEEEHWDLIIDSNLKGTFLCSQAAIAWMRRTKTPGRIVNMASIAGRTGTGSFTSVAYAAAKGGVIALTRKLAKEVGGFGIRVNAIAPGLVISGDRIRTKWESTTETEQQMALAEIPLKRLSTVEDQVNAIFFLAAPHSDYITGVVLDVNGGRFIG